MARAAGGRSFKVTFPAASIFTHPLTTVAGQDGGGYGSLEEFVQHAIEIERQLVADAIGAGVRYLQFDLPLYARTSSVIGPSRGALCPGGRPDYQTPGG